MSAAAPRDTETTRGVRRLFTGLLIRLTSFCSAGLTVAAACYFVAPYSRFAETATHFLPFYAVAGVLGTGAACGLRYWKLSGLCATLTVLYLALIAPWYFPRAAPHSSDEPNLRVVTANLLSINNQKDRLFEYVVDIDPDVLFVQEYSPAWARSAEPLKNDYPHFVERVRSDHFGIALFSKLPLENTDVFYPAAERFPAIRADVQVNGRVVTLLNLHPVPPMLSDLFAIRNRQLEAAAQLVRDQDNLVIVAGDLNITMWSPYYDNFKDESGLANSRRGFGVHPTWPANLPLLQLPLDHVLTSPDIHTLEFDVGPEVGSDHLPVIVDLWIPPEEAR